LQPNLVLYLVLALWAALALPGLAEQWETSARVRELLAGKSYEERASLVDHPAYPVARQIEAAVPERGCVTILAQAGPEALDYYNARFDYLLYPRRAQAFADSSAEMAGCDYLAVFRDTPQNLQASPFEGRWNEAEIEARTAEAEPVARGSAVTVYRLP